MHSRTWVRVLVEGVGSSGAGVTSGCEPPDVGAGSQILVCWKENKYS